MSQYIYTVTYRTEQGKVDLALAATRKWVVQGFIRDNYIAKGESIAPLVITRSKDGSPFSRQYIDTYEFMQIDPGEL